MVCSNEQPGLCWLLQLPSDVVGMTPKVQIRCILKELKNI